jgi:hypothetical protein
MAFGDVVQTNTGSGTTATTAPTLPGGVTAGNLIVLTYAADDYNGSPNAGWTQSTGMEQQTFHGGYLWWFIATSNGQTIPSYTVGSAVRSHYNIAEYEGPFDAAPYDVSQGQFQQASTITYTTPAITPTSGSRLLIAGLNFQQSTADIAAPGTWQNGFTQVTSSVLNGANPRLAVGQARLVVTANGSTAYSSGATMGTSQVAGSESGLIIAFKAGASSGSNLTATPADAEALTDTATATAARPRSPADPLPLSDTATPVAARPRTQGDPLGMTDSVTVTRSGARTETPGDPLGLTDSLTVAWDRAATIGDGLGLTDPGQTSDAGTTHNDPLALTDDVAATRSGATTASQADPLPLTDSLTVERSSVGAANPADGLGLSDEVTVAWQRVGTVDDFLALTDTPTTSQSSATGTTQHDPLGITDDPAWSATRPRNFGDGLGLSDSVVAVLERVEVLTDDLALTDAVTAQRTSLGDGTPVDNPKATLTVAASFATLTVPDSKGTLT